MKTKTVTLWHATNGHNVESIRVGGLLKRFSRGKAKRCWLHKRGMRPWAVLHVAKNHAWKAEHVYCIAFTVPADMVKRFKGGLYYVEGDVPAAYLKTVEHWLDD